MCAWCLWCVCGVVCVCVVRVVRVVLSSLLSFSLPSFSFSSSQFCKYLSLFSRFKSLAGPSQSLRKSLAGGSPFFLRNNAHSEKVCSSPRKKESRPGCSSNSLGNNEHSGKALHFFSFSFHCLLIVFLIVFSLSSHCLLIVFSLSSHCLLIVFSSSSHLLLIFFSSSSHLLLIFFSSSSHLLFSFFSVSFQYLFSIFSVSFQFSVIFCHFLSLFFLLRDGVGGEGCSLFPSLFLSSVVLILFSLPALVISLFSQQQ